MERILIGVLNTQHALADHDSDGCGTGGCTRVPSLLDEPKIECCGCHDAQPDELSGLVRHRKLRVQRCCSWFDLRGLTSTKSGGAKQDLGVKAHVGSGERGTSLCDSHLNQKPVESCGKDARLWSRSFEVLET